MTEYQSTHLQATSGTTLRWSCESCHFPIADGQGVLCAPYIEISDPDCELIRWRPQHTTCANAEHVDYYGIDIEAVSTPVGLLWWSAHLIGKNWLRDSNWDAWLRSAYQALRQVSA